MTVGTDIGGNFRVRVAYSGGANDYSIGAVYDPVAGTYGELVWIDGIGTATPRCRPQYFGNADFYCYVKNAATTRTGHGYGTSDTLPLMVPTAYVQGTGTKAQVATLNGGSVSNGVYYCDLDTTTSLPTLTITNKAIIDIGYTGLHDTWTYRVPEAIYWNGTNNIQKSASTNPFDGSVGYNTGLNTFQNGQTNITSWLGTNLPEFGTPMLLGFNSIYYTTFTVADGRVSVGGERDSVSYQYFVEIGRSSTGVFTLSWSAGSTTCTTFLGGYQNYAACPNTNIGLLMDGGASTSAPTTATYVSLLPSNSSIANSNISVPVVGGGTITLACGNPGASIVLTVNSAGRISDIQFTEVHNATVGALNWHFVSITPWMFINNEGSKMLTGITEYHS